ncbi:MAG TPA: hypothetical protein VN840_18150 [Streptosporangiaceae bacterium]|nr:hypothetical protein [Streptosporangiaceae bacterium]
MSRAPVLVTIGKQRPFSCTVCRGTLFYDRQVQLNTRGLEFMRLEWMNKSGISLICARCGYMHTFVNDAIEMWEQEGGYPEAAAQDIPG